jgi:predicted ferric reductase
MSINEFIQWFFALDSAHIWWFISRSAGIVAFLLLWLSTAWGLAVPSKIFDPLLARFHTFDFHEFISLLAVGFLLLHIFVLTLDHYLPYSLIQILIPFIAPANAFWVGIGVIAFYLILLVTVTFYMRRRIGMHTFRMIHLFSLVAFVGAALHGIFSGTDTPLTAMKLMYEGTFLSIVFLTTFWLVRGRLNRQPTPNPT